MKIGGRKELRKEIEKSLDEANYVDNPFTGWLRSDTLRSSKTLAKNLKNLKGFPHKKITKSFVIEFVDSLEGYRLTKAKATTVLTRDFYDYFYKGEGVF